MEIAIKISEDLLRDSAVCQIVVLYLRANDLKTASILFRAVQAEFIGNDMLNDHPALRYQSLNQGDRVKQCLHGEMQTPVRDLAARFARVLSERSALLDRSAQGMPDASAASCARSR